MIGMITAWSNSTLPERLSLFDKPRLYQREFRKRRQRLKHIETLKHRSVWSPPDQTPLCQRDFWRGNSHQQLKHRSVWSPLSKTPVYQREFRKRRQRLKLIEKLKHRSVWSPPDQTPLCQRDFWRGNSHQQLKHRSYGHRFLKLQFTRWTFKRRQRLKHRNTDEYYQCWIKLHENDFVREETLTKNWNTGRLQFSTSALSAKTFSAAAIWKQRRRMCL